MIGLIRWLLAAALAVLPLAGLCVPANAYEVAPMRIMLVPAEGKSSSTVSVNNIRDTDLPVEIKVKRRTIAEDGTQTFEPAEDDFIVFPPQAAVPARQSQAFRFEYIGPPPAGSALSYVIEVAEVPVLPPGFSGVQFAYNFGVAVYIEPPKAFVKLVTKARAENGILTLDIENSGSKYALLTDLELIIEVAGAKRTLSPGEIGRLVQNPLIAPGARRLLTLSLADIADLPAEGPAAAEFRRP